MLGPGKEILKSVSIAHSILPQVATAEVKGAGVDLQGYEAALATINVGTSGDTLSGSVYAQPTLQESVDDVDADYSDVATADYGDSVTFPKLDAGSKVSKAYAVSYVGSKRWIRVVWKVTGTHTTGTSASALVVRANPRVKPTVQGT